VTASKVSSTRRGAEGERKAAEFMTERGWIVLGRNFRSAGGEVDIIAEKGDTVAFIEVKAWDVLPQGELEHSIDARKQARIARAARSWLSRRRALSGKRLRFDVIFLARGASEIHHIENAFSGGID
jgi:putative endonuclease